jgi:hypothetical protein
MKLKGYKKKQQWLNLRYSIAPAFAWKDCGKNIKPIRIAGSPIQDLNPELPEHIAKVLTT